MALIPGLGNPFTQLMNIPDTERFYGREELLHAILKGITAPTPTSFVLRGIRTSGKTSLLRYLQEGWESLKSAHDGHPAFTMLVNKSVMAPYTPRARRGQVGERQLLFVYVQFLAGQWSNPQHQSTTPSPRYTQYSYPILAALFNQLFLACDSIPDLAQVGLVTPPSNMNNWMDLRSSLRRSLERLEHARYRVVFLLDNIGSALTETNLDDERGLCGLVSSAAFVTTIDFKDYSSLQKVDARTQLDPPFTHLLQDDSRMQLDSPFINLLQLRDLGLLTEQEANDLVCLSSPAEEVVATQQGITSLSSPNAGERQSPFTGAEVAFLLRVAGRNPSLLTAVRDEYFRFRETFPKDMLESLTEPPQTAPSNSTNLNSTQWVFVRILLQSENTRRILRILWSEVYLRFERLVLCLIADHVTDILSKPQFDSEPEQYYLSVRALQNKGLIVNDAGNQEVFAQLFELYVQEKYSDWLKHNQPTLDEMREHVQNQLGPKDQAVFEYLIKNRARICSYDEIFQKVWETHETPLRALNASISRLRGAIAQIDWSGWDYFVNERGKGYTFRPRE